MTIKHWDFNMPFMDNLKIQVLGEIDLQRRMHQAMFEGRSSNGLVREVNYLSHVQSNYSNSKPSCQYG